MKKSKLFKMFAILLAVMVVLPACGSGESLEVTHNTNREESEPTDWDTNEDRIENEDEEFSESKKEEDSIYQVTDTVLKAYQNLDAEALKPYIEDENDYEDIVAKMESIKSNPEDVEFWNNTVGTMIYFPDSDVLLAKSIDDTYASWYTDCWKKGEEIPEEESKDFSDEYLDQIYNNYYKDAPYVADFNFSNKFLYMGEDGTYKVSSGLGVIQECDAMLDAAGIDYTNIRSYILLYNNDCFSLGYDYLGREDAIPEYETILSGDLDAIVKILEEKNLFEDDYFESSFESCFNNYYLNEENRAVLQQLLQEGFELKRDLSNIVLIMPSCLTESYTFAQLTDTDRETIKEMELEVVITVKMFDLEDSDDFNLFDQFVDEAIEHGVLE